MSTEINFINPIGGLINLFKAATTVADVAVKASTAAKEREEIRRYKSELVVGYPLSTPSSYTGVVIKL